MEAVSTPRISAKHLDRYVNNTVIVVGKVLQLRGDTATIDADGNIQVNLNPVSGRNLPPQRPGQHMVSCRRVRNILTKASFALMLRMPIFPREMASKSSARCFRTTRSRS